MFWKDGFYETAVSGAVEIDNDTYRALLAAMERGQVIATASDGSPQAVDASSSLTLDERKTKKIQDLTSTCSACIIGGYTSSALGSTHTYPSKTTDQINMMGSVSASLLPGITADWSTPFWCEDSDGVWAFRMHSAAQIQTAGADGKAHVVLCQSTLEQLTSTIMAATTVEAIDAVVWPSV